MLEVDQLIGDIKEKLDNEKEVLKRVDEFRAQLWKSAEQIIRQLQEEIDYPEGGTKFSVQRCGTSNESNALKLLIGDQVIHFIVSSLVANESEKEARLCGKISSFIYTSEQEEALLLYEFSIYADGTWSGHQIGVKAASTKSNNISDKKKIESVIISLMRFVSLEGVAYWEDPEWKTVPVSSLTKTFIRPITRPIGFHSSLN